MLKLIRANNKIFLAGLMIALMLTFLLNRGNGNGGTGSADRVFGTAYGKPIYTSELSEVRAELAVIGRYPSAWPGDRSERTILEHFFGPELPAEILSKPQLLLLLRREANDKGITVSEDEVQSILVNHAPPLEADSDQYAAAHAGVMDVLKINARYQQVANAFKVSRPMVNQLLVTAAESLQMNLVQIRSSDFAAKVPAPTTQQVQDQFTRFADVSPHHPLPDTNPFGFGYRLPLRVKLQYAMLSSDAVAAAVIATKSPYDWEVAANKYYLLHPDEFTIKPPTSAPANTPVIQQPFILAHDQVLKTIRQPMITALMDQVQGYLSATMNTDWHNDLQSSTSGAGEPDSSLGVRYSSFSYLSKLLEQVKLKFNVVLTINDLPDYLSEEQIATLPGIGTDALSEYVSTHAASYLAQIDAKELTATAQLLRPSTPLTGPAPGNNVVFVRLTEVLRSQSPANVSLVRSQVEADVKTAAAYKLAQGEANHLQLAAESGALLANALADGHPIIPITGESPLRMYSNQVAGVEPPLGDSAPSFTKQAFQLLSTYDPDKNPHPAGKIELPEQARIFVSQLTHVDARWNSENFYKMSFSAAEEVHQMREQSMIASWFSPDAIEQRAGFKSTKPSDNS